MNKADFLVIYYQHQLNRNLPSKLLEALKYVVREHTIFINGVEYIRIYDVKELPKAAFEPDINQ